MVGCSCGPYQSATPAVSLVGAICSPWPLPDPPPACCLRLLCPTEILTGKGALAQFGYEVGLNTSQVDVFIVGLIAFNAIAALLPTSGTFVPDEEVESRPAGPLQDPTISLLNPKKFFSFKSFGFTKENELLVGRTAQLGFAASILGEYLTGKGPLAQFDFGECPAPAGCC